MKTLWLPIQKSGGGRPLTPQDWRLWLFPLQHLRFMVSNAHRRMRMHRWITGQAMVSIPGITMTSSCPCHQVWIRGQWGLWWQVFWLWRKPAKSRHSSFRVVIELLSSSLFWCTEILDNIGFYYDATCLHVSFDTTLCHTRRWLLFLALLLISIILWLS